MEVPVRLPRLHIIATDEVALGRDFRASAARLFAACGPDVALHLRLRRLAARTFHGLAAEMSGLAAEGGGWCVVNGRVDVALTAGAQAVQLGTGALPVGVARALLPPGTVIGASVHDPAGAALRQQEGADYLVLGTIFASATHPDRPAAGPELVRACRDVDLPVIAIGGITEQRVAEVVEAGAWGVAVVSCVWGAADPVAAAVGLRRRLPSGEAAAYGETTASGGEGKP